MHVKANQTFEITREATIKSLDRRKAMPGGRLRTLTLPRPAGDGEDKVLVAYMGQDRPGEAPNGGEFWVRISALARHSRLVA